MYCMVTDTVTHYLCECQIVKEFWSLFKNWWHKCYDVNIALGAADVIFGILNPNEDIILDVLNYCILFAKRFIHKCQQGENNNNINFIAFKYKLKKRIMNEKFILENSNKLELFQMKWEPLLITD